MGGDDDGVAAGPAAADDYGVIAGDGQITVYWPAGWDQPNGTWKFWEFDVYDIDLQTEVFLTVPDRTATRATFTGLINGHTYGVAMAAIGSHTIMPVGYSVIGQATPRANPPAPTVVPSAVDLTLKARKKSLSGSLTSANSACLAGRPLVLERKMPRQGWKATRTKRAIVTAPDGRYRVRIDDRLRRAILDRRVRMIAPASAACSAAASKGRTRQSSLTAPHPDMTYRGRVPPSPDSGFVFSGTVLEWRGPAPFHFLEVPAEISDDIKEAARGQEYWGQVAVEVRIGDTDFRTALFPKEGRYLVPLKVAVRRAEGIEVGQQLTAVLELAARS